ncbi:MAG: hypothetical protein BMS9Abin22_014 [Gammaproteobacteria bacterium]|nr:MAG: hypothetical protein BMS9Abin22_014 [Gammaproteobacteria bacterium]
MGLIAKHVIIYLVGALVLVGLAIYAAVGTDNTLLMWTGVIAAALWVLLYIPFAFWWEYWKFVRLALDARELMASDSSKPADLKPILMTIATDHVGIPGFLARRIINRIDQNKFAAKLRRTGK